MALQAHLHLAICGQLGRVNNAAFTFGVSLSGPVAALAIDTHRQPAVRLRRISVVTEQAGIRDFAPEVGMIGAVVSRAHRPISAALGVPAYGKLDQLLSLVAMNKRSRVISRANDVIDPFLNHVRRLWLHSPQITRSRSL